MTFETRIREAGFNDISLLAGLVRECFQDVAERFGLTLENCPKHPSHCTDDTELKRWYLKIGFVEGETNEFDHLPFLVLFMTYTL